MKSENYKLYKRLGTVSMATIMTLSFCSCSKQTDNKISLNDTHGNALVGVVYDYGKEGLSDDFYGYLKKEDDNIIFVDALTKDEQIIDEDEVIYYSLVTDLLSKNLLKKVNNKEYISADDLSNVDKYYISTRVGNGVNLYSKNLKATNYTKLACTLSLFDKDEYFSDNEESLLDKIFVK